MVPFVDTVIVRFDSKILLMESALSNSALVLSYIGESLTDPILSISPYSMLFPPVPTNSSELQVSVVPFTEQITIKVSSTHVVIVAQVMIKFIAIAAAAV